MTQNNNIVANNIFWNNSNRVFPYGYYNESGTEDERKIEREKAVDRANEIVGLLRRDARRGYNRLHWEKMPRVVDIKRDVKNYLRDYIKGYVEMTTNVSCDREYVTSLVYHLVVNDYLPRTKWAICNHPCIVKDVA